MEQQLEKKEILKIKGAKLRQIREEKGLKPKDITGTINYSVRNIYHYEEGENDAPLDYVMLMANLGNYEVKSILDPKQELQRRKDYPLTPEEIQHMENYRKANKRLRALADAILELPVDPKK